MTAVRRIAELKRDDMPFIIRLEDGREFSVDSVSSVEIDVSANGGDRMLLSPEDFSVIGDMWPPEPRPIR